MLDVLLGGNGLDLSEQRCGDWMECAGEARDGDNAEQQPVHDQRGAIVEFGIGECADTEFGGEFQLGLCGSEERLRLCEGSGKQRQWLADGGYLDRSSD